MSLPANIHSEIEQIYQAHTREICSVFLLGSWAQGHARPESDIDLLVVLKDSAVDSWVAIRQKLLVAITNVEAFMLTESEIRRPLHFCHPSFRSMVGVLDHGKCIFGQDLTPQLAPISATSMRDFRGWSALMLCYHLNEWEALSVKHVFAKSFAEMLLLETAVFVGKTPITIRMNKRQMIASLAHEWPAAFELLSQIDSTKAVKCLRLCVPELAKMSDYQWSSIPLLLKVGLEDQFGWRTDALASSEERQKWQSLKIGETLQLSDFTKVSQGFLKTLHDKWAK